ncbi:phospho-sugar mutase [Microbacterium xanthum]|uniref:phospho-sugar mutase n=1 Tax=Microbacterium xanthum TaxID=3079794 RepID=UPI002AD576C9|nr:MULTISPECIES: phospho-sugar mutase [unclassified Microbacterium]MDZ8171024.1 phospho-sugar mutase [Microbacterium sp. KSW-48]MDZ8201541.1 phospho-sugar mutase [Microbacterium sp. SSW1-59]
MDSTAHEDLLDRARAWLAQDPDPDTRAELRALLEAAEVGDADALDAIHDRFATRLAFGTAGLRGELGAGTNRMNRVLVAQAAAGLAAYIAERAGVAAAEDEGAAPAPLRPEAPVVVVGYDGRRNSDVFARDSAEIFAGAGLRAVLLPRMLPTPVLAFAVRHLSAAAGVMVTASHNPPNDNGYKVYLGGDDEGSQIVSPADAEIAAHIQRIADAGDIAALPRSLAFETAPEELVTAYIEATAAVAPAPESAEGMTWVYTAMHGVGWETLSAIVERAGYPAPIVVPAQIEPDGSFPTVVFPNPEEPGAMDLSFAAADEAQADFVIANDPDADRLAVALPDPTGGWRRLTGNEIGLLLGWRAARLAQDSDGPRGSLACSLVSSPGLQAVAEAHGLDFHATLTGFKWISRAPGIVFGFEEALGYLVNPETVRDKDGISAAVAVLGLAADARRAGRTLADLLAEFDETFGVFASDQVSVRTDDVAAVGTMMSALRAQHPESLGGVPVTQVDDLLEGVDGLPPGDVLRLWLDDGSRVIVRPSGTEPKLKVYLDVRAESAQEATERLANLADGARVLLDGLA